MFPSKVSAHFTHLMPPKFLIDSVRNFLRKNKFGQFSDQAKDANERARQKEIEEENKSKLMKIGDRCEVTVSQQPAKLGSVQFIGMFIFQNLIRLSKSVYMLSIKLQNPIYKLGFFRLKGMSRIR